MKLLLEQMRPVLLATLGACLSILFAPLAAVPLFLLRALYGRGLYWFLNLVFVITLVVFKKYEAGYLLFIMSVLAGTFIEFHTRFLKGLFVSGLVSVVATVAAAAVFAIPYLSLKKLSLTMFIQEKAELITVQMQQLMPQATIEPQELLSQIPSGIVIMLMFSTWLGLLALRASRSIRSSNVSFPLGLIWFRVPDIVIWPFLLSILLTFGGHGYELVRLVSLNVFNVLVILYFFQGLAVVAAYFRVYRVNSVLQTLFYVFILFQLLLFLSVIGLADFWLDFRHRLVKKTTERMGEV